MKTFLTLVSLSCLFVCSLSNTKSPETTSVEDDRFETTYDKVEGTDYDETEACSSGDYEFAYGTYTVTKDGVTETIEECQFCFCQSISGGSGNTYKCEEAAYEGLFNKISSVCELDCEYSNVIWSENCECPSCNDATGTNTNTNTNTDDDDDVYEDDQKETWDTKYDDAYYMIAKFDITVTRIWNSRSEVWAVLKQALRLILKSSSDYVEDDVQLYISYFDAEIIDTDTTGTGTDGGEDGSSDSGSDGSGGSEGGSDSGSGSGSNDGGEDRGTESPTNTKDGSLDSGNNVRRRRRIRRRLLQTDEPVATGSGSNGGKDGSEGGYDTVDGSEGDTRDNTKDDDTRDNTKDDEEVTVNFSFEITFFDDQDTDGTNIASWYDYLISLATTYSTDYATNCQDEALSYSNNGFGTVTVNYASLTTYDQDGNTEESTQYGTDDGDSSGSGGNESSDANGKFYFNNVVFVVVAGVWSVLFMMQ